MHIKITNKILTPVFAILALILFSSMNLMAAPHDLDPTFGNGGIVNESAYQFEAVTFGGDGIVIIGEDNPEENYYSGNAAAVDIQGKIVIAGGFYGAAVYRFPGASRSLAFDFDCDGRADVSAFRPSDRTWYLNQSTNEFSATQFGLSTDKLTPADYDGDGRADAAIFRDGVWWLRQSTNGVAVHQFGVTSDKPVPAAFLQ